ncbi:Uncharacterized protein SCF082_LOCUS18603 [Durusdinium trenchii]|uniref:Uncharacterized protein n=1 Tax=Durusdinium trenchii TaxID=1381693 RepID=A0ABP0KQ42_9DINO
MAAAGLAFFVYVPYAEYVTGFLNEAGKFPQGFMMGLLSFLIGLTWWAMCMMIGEHSGLSVRKMGVAQL